MAMVLFPRDPIVALGGPSKAQREAGNYAMQRVNFQGLKVSIENPRGTMRAGVDPTGAAWATGMQHHYGYIRGTLGVDGDHFDCFLGPNKSASHAYVITTMKPPGFTVPDEQKAMLGFDCEEHAREAFREAYDDPGFMGACVTMPMAEFKNKVMGTRAAPAMLKALFFVRPGRDGTVRP